MSEGTLSGGIDNHTVGLSRLDLLTEFERNVLLRPFVGHRVAIMLKDLYQFKGKVLFFAKINSLTEKPTYGLVCDWEDGSPPEAYPTGIITSIYLDRG